METIMIAAYSIVALAILYIILFLVMFYNSVSTKGMVKKLLGVNTQSAQEIIDEVTAEEEKKKLSEMEIREIENKVKSSTQLEGGINQKWQA